MAIYPRSSADSVAVAAPVDLSSEDVKQVPSKLSAPRNSHLDAMRGIAALVVVFDHLRGSFFLPYRQPGTGLPIGHGLLVRLIYMDHYYARVAVIVFFALSGYLVGSSAIKAIQNNVWSWSNYLLTRLTRLYVVLIPALLLTACFDFFGRSFPISSPSYLAVDRSSGFNLASLDTFASFWGTLFFVQNIYTKVFGTFGPAWSLANEFWYYILFPLCAICFIQRRRLFFHLAILVVLAIFAGSSILILFPTWLGGMVAGECAKRHPLRSMQARTGIFSLSMAAAIGTVLASAAHRLNGTAGDYILGLASVGLIWVALCSPPAKGFYASLALFSSEISYTLYLTHQPLLTLVSACWMRQRRWFPDFPHLLLALVPMGIAVLFAYLAYLLFESRTDAVRRYLRTYLKTSPKIRQAA